MKRDVTGLMSFAFVNSLLRHALNLCDSRSCVAVCTVLEHWENVNEDLNEADS